LLRIWFHVRQPFDLLTPGSSISEQRRQGEVGQAEHLREAEAALLGEALGWSTTILPGKTIS